MIAYRKGNWLLCVKLNLTGHYPHRGPSPSPDAGRDRSLPNVTFFREYFVAVRLSDARLDAERARGKREKKREQELENCGRESVSADR